MTAKQYLKQGYRLKELIQTHRDELAQLRGMLGSVQGPSYDKIGGGATKWNGDTAEYNLVIKCVDLEAQIAQEIDDMVALMTAIHSTIAATARAAPIPCVIEFTISSDNLYSGIETLDITNPPISLYSITLP